MRTDILWQSVLGEIEVSITQANFAAWFKNTSLLERTNERVVIGVPGIFAQQQLKSKFNALILETLKRHGVKAKNLEYRVHSAKTRIQDAPPGAQVAARDTQVPILRETVNGLNPRYSFDNFIVGSSNDLAYSAAQAVVREPGKKYNPLFIYGGAGLGKTHLLHAAGNAIMARNPATKIISITCEQFLKDFVASMIRKGAFSNRYRNADILIVDDMQIIANKEKVQEEFFHTFNTLHEAGKQIILSSDRPPKDIPTLEDRLQSRFDWGMTVDVQIPDYETRVAILMAKVKDKRRSVPADVIEYLATHIQSNIRELEGALNRLFGYFEMRGLVPSLELVEQMINPPSIKSKHITSLNILHKTARFFSLSVEEMISPRRDRAIAEARQIAMYLMRVELNLSYPRIAKEVGRSDHTTAIHSVNKIEKALLNNHHLRRKVFDLKEKLYV